MAKSKDLFDDTTMSFGEHLEVLRVHLWKAIVGVVIAVLGMLFVGDRVMAIVRAPIDRALREYDVEQVDDNVQGFDFWDYLKSYVGGERAATGNSVTDAGLEHLKKLKSLQHVDLTDTRVTSAGVRALKKSFPNLTTAADPLTVAGLEHLAKRGGKGQLDDDFHLRSLYLAGTEVTDDDLDLTTLGGLEHLERLDLRQTGIGDKGLKHLENLTGLRQLNLRETKITDRGLASLSGLANLEVLDLRADAITDNGLIHLAGLVGLRELNLYSTGVTDGGLEYLHAMRNLQKLYLSGASITDAGLAQIAGLSALQSLNLSGTRISDDGLVSLKDLKQLRELNLFAQPRQHSQKRDDGSLLPADRDTIVVTLNSQELAAKLPAAGGRENAPEDAIDDPTIALRLSAPEFGQFRLTSEKIDRPITLNVQEAFMTYIKVAIVSGLLLSSPWVFYQIWQFVAAGLYPHEQKYVYTYLPISISLFLGGAVFCFVLVFPYVLNFLLGFNKWLGITAQIRLSEWISFAIILPLMFGISFQLPLVMLFLERISIFEAKDYREKRRMSILVIAILSMLLTPADPASMLLMMVPLLFLYELGIVFCEFGAPKSPFEAEAA